MCWAALRQEARRNPPRGLNFLQSPLKAKYADAAIRPEIRPFSTARSGAAHALVIVLASSLVTTVGSGGGTVLDIEPRVKVVEERMADHQQRFEDVVQALRQFEGRVDRRFASVDARFGQIDVRFGQLDAGLAAINQRIDRQVAEIATLRRDMTTQFRWTAGLMLTGAVAIVAAVLSQ
jgi:hypothetical protein